MAALHIILWDFALVDLLLFREKIDCEFLLYRTAGWSNAIKTLERTAIGFCCFRVRILLLFRLTPAFANGLFKMQKTEEAASPASSVYLSERQSGHKRIEKI